MLILTRKRSEMINIGENIVIKVIRTGRSTVKLGVHAPADVKVLRSEIADYEVVARKGDVLERAASQDGVESTDGHCVPRPHVAQLQ